MRRPVSEASAVYARYPSVSRKCCDEFPGSHEHLRCCSVVRLDRVVTRCHERGDRQATLASFCAGLLEITCTNCVEHQLRVVAALIASVTPAALRNSSSVPQHCPHGPCSPQRATALMNWEMRSVSRVARSLLTRRRAPRRPIVCKAEIRPGREHSCHVCAVATQARERGGVGRSVDGQRAVPLGRPFGAAAGAERRCEFAQPAIPPLRRAARSGRRRGPLMAPRAGQAT